MNSDSLTAQVVNAFETQRGPRVLRTVSAIPESRLVRWQCEGVIFGLVHLAKARRDALVARRRREFGAAFWRLARGH